jgi:hypothetical protein
VTAADAVVSVLLVGTFGLSLEGLLILAGGLATPVGGAEIEDAIDSELIKAFLLVVDSQTLPCCLAKAGNWELR